VLTLGLIVYAGFTWANEIFFDDRYRVTIALEDTGGMVEDHWVTLYGNQVGIIDKMELTEEGIVAELAIFPEARVPRHAFAQIIRRSAIGEHTLNLIPVPEGWEPDPEVDQGGLVVARFIEPMEGWEPAEEGDQIHVAARVIPPETRDIIEKAEDLFRALPKDDLYTTIFELGTAFGGRGEVLVDLNRNARALNETFVENIPHFERLLDASEPVLEALHESREGIGEMVTHVADLSELLAGQRPTMEALIDSSGRFTAEADTLIRAIRPNFNCLVRDLRDLQAMNNENLHWIAQFLDYNTAFFWANDFARQYDPWRPGVNWNRSGTLTIQESTGEVYEEGPRQTPATRPGAACESPFGLGVNAIRQADHQPPHPTSPGIEWAPLLDEGDVQARPVGAPAETDPSARRVPTPVTGGSLAIGLIPLLAGAILIWIRRRD
jgi:ABC-type transporter Mla subunit MlaD